MMFVKKIGLGKSKGIPFYTFTDCGVASAIRGKRKCCLAKWNAHPVASPVCTKLSMIPPIIGNEEQKVLEKFYIPY